MTAVSTPSQIYQARSREQEQSLRAINRRYNFLSWLRLLVFLVGAALTWYLFAFQDFWFGMLGGVATLLGFFYLIKQHSQVAQQREHRRRLLALCATEQEALAWAWQGFDPGKEFIDPQHAFSYDLDLFGRGSVFQYLNRSGTLPGRQRLAQWLQAPLLDAEAIMARQAAVKTLASDIDWQLDFQARGSEQAAGDLASISQWGEQPPFYQPHPWYPRLVWLLPSLFFLALAGWIIPDFPGLRELIGAYRLPGSIPLLLFLGNLALTAANLRRTNQEQQQVGRRSRLLQTYARLFQAIEKSPWEAPWWQERRQGLGVGKEKSASEAIGELADLTYSFDQRLNAIAGILLNGMLLWDFRYLIKLERWRMAHRADLNLWFDILAEVDALNSLGRLAHNRPELGWPTLQAGPFSLHAQGLGHLLLKPEGRVDNDVALSQPGEFLIVTGANMAGKSTFLRTMGVSLILAQIGAPVCARRYELVPIEMITSVRATDSLTDHESYFYAELKRLKRVIDKLKEGQPVFIIVDEMLRGTNSRDKQEGSRRFIEQLIRLGGVGLVATHDLSLGTLADEYPGQARNQRFEVDIENDELFFDYRLREGISQNLNATFLMQKMGIM